jgi:hypothetical protein
MSLEQAKALLKRIQEGTATDEDRKLASIAYSIVNNNMLSKLGVPHV